MAKEGEETKKKNKQIKIGLIVNRRWFSRWRRFLTTLQLVRAVVTVGKSVAVFALLDALERVVAPEKSILAAERHRAGWVRFRPVRGYGVPVERAAQLLLLLLENSFVLRLGQHQCPAQRAGCLRRCGLKSGKQNSISTKPMARLSRDAMDVYLCDSRYVLATVSRGCCDYAPE